MTNIADCIARARADGHIDPVRAAEAIEVFEKLRDRYAQIMPLEVAEVQAARDLKEATKRAVTSRFHMRINQMRVNRKLEAAILSAENPADILTSLIEQSPNREYVGESVVGMQHSMSQTVNAGLADFLAAASQKITGGSRDPALVRDVLRGMFGETVENPAAREMAQAFQHVQEMMRRQFNAHGGDIGKLENRGVSQSHDAHLLKKAGQEAWIDDIMERLDWARIEDHRTGKPFSADGKVPKRADVEPFLTAAYENIVSGGWTAREASMQSGGRAMYNRHADHRVLHFKSADDFLGYNARFGGKDPFSAMMNDAHSLGRDVAAMRVLGPNPAAGLEYAIQVATKRLNTEAAQATTPAARKAVQRKINSLRKKGPLAKAMLDEVSGAASVPESEFWARFMSGTRNVLSSAYLGSALLSSTTDVVTASLGAKIVGMHPGNVLSRHVKLMASSLDRQTAAQAGYVAESLANAGGAALRWSDEGYGSEITRRMSDFTMRAQGLTFWTDQLRNAFRMETAAFMAREAGKDFAGIAPELRAMMEARGIGAADWDLLRNPEHLFTTKTGEQFLSLSYWRHATDVPADAAFDLATRMGGAIEEALEMAVPTQRIETRAMVLGGTRPGTILGEIARSGLQFKNYPLSFMVSQYRYFMSLPTGMERTKYLASFGTGLLLMGALAMQLKEIVKGRDPREMDSPAFWMAAAAQSGGLGLFGDFFFSETSRTGGGIVAAAAGPTAGLLSDLVSIPANAVQRLAEGETPLIGRDVSNLGRRNMPVASSLWQTRLLYDRLGADTLQDFLDPEAEQAFRAARRRAERDYKTSHWWAPGEKAPGRAPNIPNALGGSR